MEIDRKIIEDWAKQYSSQSDFPLLVSMMVYATLAPGDYSFIPWGSAINIGGWDGLVCSEKGAGFIPVGRSIIEFGTDDKTKTKAEHDFNTRINSKNEVIDRKQTTFIFMTPRCWKGCEKWQEEKKKEKVWKDVRVYDSRGIADLLKNMQSVTAWLARKIGLRPERGVVDAERYWIEGSLSPVVTLNSRFFVAGRTAQIEKLEKTMSSEIPIVGVLASSKEEAIDFILAAGMSFSGDNSKRFKSKAIVVEDAGALRNLPTNQHLIIIPTFEDARSLYYMAVQGNCVLIPLGADTDYQQVKIELTRPDKQELVSALEECGLDHDRAENTVRDATCSITAIKKELGFFVQRAEWLNNENVSELFAALLCGRWDEKVEGDKHIIEQLTGKPYGEYRQMMVRWSGLPLSPVLQIGTTWRLVSPLSLWADLKNHLIVNWQGLLNEVCLKVFLHSDSDTEEKYSTQLRDGLLQSLIIVALHGQRLRFIGNGQEYVNGIVEEILRQDTSQQWKHIHSSLMMFAEAAPEVFIKYVHESLANPEHSIISLFEENKEFFFPESHHADLLWALEGLAWAPEYLKETTELLLELTEQDPGGTLGNRPFNSLIEIYNPWVPQTSVDNKSRSIILRGFIDKQYSRMWDLLLALLPKIGMVFSFTHKPRWRQFDYELVKSNPQATLYQFISDVVDMLKTSYDGSDKKMAEIINHIEPLPHKIRKELIDWIGATVKSLKGHSAESSKALREALWYQGLQGRRDYTDFSKEELEAIKKAYEDLVPQDVVQRDIWLFDETFPHLPIPTNDIKDIDKSNEECMRLREEACRNWLAVLGVDETIDLRRRVGEPATLGNTLARIDESEELLVKVVSLLENDDDYAFARSYLAEKERKIGEEAMVGLYKTFAGKGQSVENNVRFLCCLNQSLDLWELIETLDDEIQSEYWRRVHVLFFGPDANRSLYAVEKLIAAGKAITALNGSWHHADRFPTAVLQKVLVKAISIPLELNATIDYMSAEAYLEELHKRTDRNEADLENLEWYYLPLMRHYPKKMDIELLIKHLNHDPEYFAELLTYFFIPDDGVSKDEIPSNDEEREKMRANAERAYALFDLWKNLPGVDDEGKIDADFLSDWFEKAIKAAKTRKREKGAYIQLGKLFAQYPEKSEHWPAMDLFALMETVKSESFFRNYECAMFNKRGFTSRGPYEGGDIERNESDYFKGLYKQCAVSYPKVAKVFNSLAKQYEGMAKEMDDEATITQLDY